MDLKQFAKSLDADTIRAFVGAARSVIEALLIEQQPATPTPPPGQRDYAAATLARSTPAGGWIGESELRAATQKMNEAIASEKWVEGFMVAVQLLALLK